MDRMKKLMQVFEGDDYLAWLKAGHEIGLLLENENKSREQLALHQRECAP